MKRALALLIAVMLVSPAAAQTINNLTAGGAVSGTDLYPSYQGANPAKKVTAAQLNTYFQAQIPTASSSVLGLSKCDGTTILCGSGIMQSAASVTAGTTQTVTAAQWAGGTTFVVTTTGQTLTLPVSSSLSTNGGIAIQTIGQSVTLAPNAADAINGGTAGASITLPAGITAYATTDGAGGIHVSPTSAGGGGSGTVTTMSVVSANGLAGTVANPTTTPAVTLSTTITGVLKGNGTAISAAAAGTDYQAPITLTTTGTSGAATFVGNTLNIPQYTGGGGGISCPTGFTLSIGQCVWTQTASASSSLSWTGLTGNSYKLVCDGLRGGNTTVYLGAQFGEGGTPTWGTTSAYNNITSYYTNGAANVLGSYSTATFIPVAYQPPTSGTIGEHTEIVFSNLQSTTLNKNTTFLTGGIGGTSNSTPVVQAGSSWYTADTNAITAIRVLDTQATPSTFSGVCTLIALF